MALPWSMLLPLTMVTGTLVRAIPSSGKARNSAVVTTSAGRSVLASRTMALKPGADGRWLDPRLPDGVTILAPIEQYNIDAHPGLTTGSAPAKMQLFDLKNDPGEQQDVAAAHPAEVERLKALFDVMNKDVPVVEEVKRVPIK